MTALAVMSMLNLDQRSELFGRVTCLEILELIMEYVKEGYFHIFCFVSTWKDFAVRLGSITLGHCSMPCDLALAVPIIALLRKILEIC